MIDAGGAPFEDRCDHDHLRVTRDFREPVGRGARDGFGEVEQGGVFTLAEILCAEEFRQTDHLRAASGGIAHHVGSMREVLIGVRPAGHLDQADAEFLSHESILKDSSRPVIAQPVMRVSSRLTILARHIAFHFTLRGRRLKHRKQEGLGTDRKLHDPIDDKLVPIHPLDLNQAKIRSTGWCAAWARPPSRASSRQAADVLEAMARDRDCFVVMTLAGAMTVAKQGLIVTELIDRGVVHAIVSTGALMAHGLVEATGRAHFRYDPRMSDVELYEAGYNRVYDTLEPERNLDDVEVVVFDVLKQWDAKEIACSWKLNRAIGEYLSKHAKGRGILKSAFKKDAPVFVPAFTDSELGLDFALTHGIRSREGQPRLGSIPSTIWSILPPRCWRRSGSEYSPSAAVCRATGRSSSVRTSTTQPARGRRRAAEALSLWRAHLSGAGLLGRALWEPIHGGGFLGEVRAGGRRRKIRRGVPGRDRRIASGGRRGAGTLKKEVSPRFCYHFTGGGSGAAAPSARGSDAP